MTDGTTRFNKTIIDSLVINKKYLFQHPSYLKAFSKIIRNIKNQSEKRDLLLEQEKLLVPPILIISVTNSCNLSCAGCYACNQNRDKTGEMDIRDIDRIINESIELGVSIFLIAGGEPLLKKGILDIPKKYPETLFVMFTNGLLVDENTTSCFLQNKNLIPVLSIEGDKETTDLRRGSGMYENIMDTMKCMHEKDIMFGSSITLTSKNFSTVLATAYLSDLQESGCAISFLIEYVPQTMDDPLILTPEQKKELTDKKNELSQKYDMLVVSLPGDEEKYDGCLAAGRGFLHISSEGALEACPFAPYSDTNIKKTPLKEALRSELIAKIRDHHSELNDSLGGCALNENREWVESLMNDK